MAWTIVNYIVDLLFFVDIIVIFNSAFNNDDFEVVEDRKRIAVHYLTGWFLIDALSIIPFDFIIVQQQSSEGFTDLARIARIGRMYKLIKLTKMIRILKIVKDRSKLLKYLEEIMKIGVGFERLLFFILIFLILCHIVCCLWVFTATVTSDDLSGTWMEEDFKDMDTSD